MSFLWPVSRSSLYRFLFPVILFCTYSTVNAQAPVANFSANPLSGCSPIIVNFTDLSSNNPTSWSWNFGNGSTSSLRNPTATYFNPGTYTVTLTATNANGSNTLVRTSYITVYAQPIVNFTANDTASCFPHPVQFTDLSSGGGGNTITSWEWDFGDGSLSSQQNPQHTYVTSGNFTVTLRVTNDKGCVRVFSKPQYIRITPGVTVSFTNSQPVLCAPPVNINFTSTSTGPGVLTYAWDFGDGGTSTLQNPSHSYNSFGNFPVTLTVTSNQGCAGTLVKNPGVFIDTFQTDFNGPDSVCLGTSATFTNTSDPISNSSFWDFGDGTTSTQTNPIKMYTSAGTYQVKLRTGHLNGCVDSVIKQIVVLPKPVANFTAPDSVKCKPPHTVNFQNTSVGGSSSWQWFFGDGGTSNLQNPSHTYTSYGSFDVTLIVTNSLGCKDSITKYGFVNIRRPIINFNGLPTEGCVPLTINPQPVITTFDTVTSYSWLFGDGNSSTLQNPTHIYPTQGTYNVTLTITTTGGCTESRTLNAAVRVGTRPTVNFTATPLVSCAKQPISFTDQSVPADQWIWHFGDGSTSTLQNPTHRYSDTGFFTVKLIAINNGCRDSIIKTNYVYILPPVARFNQSLNCSNRNQFTFTDQSVYPLTWAWDFGDGGTSNVQNPPPHTYAALGNYNVVLTVTNGACTDTAIRTVRVINENPDFTTNRTAICKNDSIMFTATNINPANIVSYRWDFGDGTQVTTGALSIWHTYTSSASYNIVLITTDVNGCFDTIQRAAFVRVNGPTANFSATNANGCSGLVTTFNDLSVTDGVNSVVSWKWNFGDGTSQTFTAPPFQHTYDSIGTFDVSLIITDAFGCIDSITLDNVVTTSNPIVHFLSYFPQSCPNTPVSFTVNVDANIQTVLWEFGDGGTSNVLVPTHSYADTGWYTVKLFITDYYGCTDSMVRPQYIRIDRPFADYIRDDTASSCIPFEVNFSNASNYYIEQLWDFNDGGTSSLQNPTHYFTTPGVFNVELLVTSPGGCKDSISRTITVYDTAGTRLNYGPLGGCLPQSVDFVITTPSPATFIWDYGDGGTDSTLTPSITHVYNTFGNFVPKVILVDPSGCIIPVPGFDTVRVVGATADFGLNDSLFCDAGLVNFIDSTTFNDPVISYNWDFGDGGTSTLQNPSHFYSSPGLYTVSLAIQTQMGCRDTARVVQQVMVVARPDIRIDGDDNACVYSTLDVAGNFNIPDTSNVTWNWNFANGNTSNLQNPPPQAYTTFGNYIITTIATNSSGCSDTISRPIRIHPLPSVIMPPDITIIAGNSTPINAIYSGNMTSYNWTPPLDLSCTTCPQPIADPVIDRLYKTTFVDSNGCENIGTVLIRVLCKGQNVFLPNTFSPNGDGNNDIFYPRGTGLNRAKVLRVFNRWGEVIFEKNDFSVNDPAVGWDGTMKGQKVSPGVYVYQAEIYCENGQLIKFSGNVALIR